VEITMKKIKWIVDSGNSFYGVFDFRKHLALFIPSFIMASLGMLLLIGVEFWQMFLALPLLTFGVGYLGFVFMPYFVIWVVENFIC